MEYLCDLEDYAIKVFCSTYCNANGQHLLTFKQGDNYRNLWTNKRLNHSALVTLISTYFPELLL